MARPVRIDMAGGWYHVTSRGNERRPIFRDERDRAHLLELLAALPGRFGVRVHAYVWMPNHYHMLLETPEANLSQAMQWFNVSYSVWFNHRHERTGHLFQGRFKGIVVDMEQWGLALSRYIHLNPVLVRRYGLSKGQQREKRAGVGEKPDPQVVAARIERLGQYRWSSYRAYVGRQPASEWLSRETVLSLGGKRGQAAAYRRYVEEAVREGLEERPWESLEEGVVLGERGFVERIGKCLRGNEREQRGLRGLRGLPSWQRVVTVVEELKRERWESFRDRYGDWGRDMALYLGRRRCGMKLAQLGELAGGIDYVSVGNAVKRFAMRTERDRNLRGLITKAERQLENG